MRILITGASGFIGSALARGLSAHELVLPSRRPEAFSAGGLKALFPPFGEDLAALVEEYRPEAVVNLLGIIRETGGQTFEKVHVDYTARLLEGARRAGTRRFVQISALGAEEGSVSRYLATKAAAERLVASAGLEYRVLRPSLVTGPGQKLFRDLARLAAFLPFLAAPGDAFAAPVRVEDVAGCLAAAALGGAAPGIYELAGDERMSFAEIFRRGLAEAGMARPVIGLPRRFFLPLLPLFALLPEPPMTAEQYRMLASPNLPSGKFPGVRELLGSVRPAFQVADKQS